jgi:DNA-binding response OmpR family regulator
MWKRVLVVSENNHFLNNLEYNLAQKDLFVRGTRARDEELMKVLTDLNPDLTILDTPLVSMHSIRQLIAIREKLDTAIMMLSTQGAMADTVRTLTLGSHALIKPLTFEQLVRQINTLLDQN